MRKKPHIGSQPAVKFNLRKYRKLFLLSCFVLFGCYHYVPPKTAEIEGVKYRTGFYGDSLYATENITYADFKDYYMDGDNKFRRVTNCENYDLILLATDGLNMNDMLYCAESQWEQARAYYSNRDNFTYYCRIGEINYNTGREPVTVALPNTEHEKFDALMLFTEKDGKDLLRFITNRNLRRMPLPDEDKTPRLVFYRESNDGFFASRRDYSLYVIDNKLLYDFYSDNKELVTIDVPDELGQYFMGLLAQAADNTVRQ